MIQLFNVIFYQPLLNLLVFFYNVIPGHDIGVAIILLTVLIKVILYPFSLKSIQSQKALQELQPKIDALKEQYKNQRDQLGVEMMKLYKEEKISPFSSCLPLLIQLPFLFAVYSVFQAGLSNGSLSQLYPFVANPGSLSPIAFGFLDLSKPQIFLAALTAAAQFWQARMLNQKKPEIKTSASRDESTMTIMNRQMVVLMPIFTFFIGISLPSGLVLYWLVITVLTALQQLVAFKRKKTPPVEVIG